MRTARVAVTLGVALLIASPLFAAEKKEKKKAPPKCPAADRIERWTQGIDVTAEQKAKFAEIAKEFGPKLMECMKKMDVMTPEQKKAAAEARKQAKADGKTDKEAAQAGVEAAKLTDEQKEKQAEARKAMQPLEKELRAKVMDVLTPEQQAKAKENMKAAKKK
jgi:Spy/CpxP family protein refolding chaperone